MRAADRSLDIIAFVTEHFRDILRRRLSELIGLGLLTVTLLGAIALATWSVQDPSLSHATDKSVHNLLGYAGAIFSDLAMQLLGLASVLLLLAPGLVGWRLLAHRPVGEKWRALMFVLGIVLAAAFTSTLPTIGSWPLPSGLGGVCGDALLKVPGIFGGAAPSGFMLFVTSVALAFTAAAALMLAIGFGRSAQPVKKAKLRPRAIQDDDVEEEDADEADRERDQASAWLGLFVHALLSWKARLGRMLRSTPHPSVPASASGRMEPRFGAYVRGAPPLIADPDYEEEDAYEEEEEEPTPRRRT